MSGCTNFDGPLAPFCAPVQGQQVPVGRTVEVTWDPNWFNSTETPMVLVQADFSLPANSGQTLGIDGFTSELIPTSAGRFTWSVLPSYLHSSTLATTARLFLAEPSETNVTTRGNRISGPRVEIVSSTIGNNNNLNNNNGNNRGANQQQTPASNGTNPIAIALPITFGILTLCFLGFCVWFKRRHPDFFRGMFAFNRRRFGRRGGNSGGGRFGFGRSKSTRLRGDDIKVVTTDMNGLRMNAMAMNGGQDRNVFREEMRRQERARY
ncbi:hypothetical protein B0T16DRAFT_380051 [Cercophora newfieldiana]|uniref:Uncharacterized protein n=1 Tax=Cercophora newfieldiana TaxID=92897 RepID=A0AA40CK34_9PEZI|nr:hypothetical protein B0T16DRAFT_380051 [Cercophora newfieldiana]